MTRAAVFRALLLTLATVGTVTGPANLRAQTPAAAQSDETRIRELLQRVEQATARNDQAGYLQLMSATANTATVGRFLDKEFRPGTSRVVVQERDRTRLQGTLPGNGYLMTVDAFIEMGDRARVATWELSVRRGDDQAWRITDQKAVSSVENIYRLSLNTSQQFDARNFSVVAEDLELTLAEGSVFTVETDQGTTGLVLMGRGEMKFHPTPRTEIEQVRLFSGTDTLESRFDVAFIRLGAFEAHADRNRLVPRASVDPRDARRAEQIFKEESPKSFVIDLADLSRDTWSLLPGPDDILAEIRTRRFDALTYTRSTAEAEDISMFERKRKRNISIYASKDKLQARGRFYNEDDLSPFDILDYEIDLAYTPERLWLDGKATMHLRVRAASLGQLTMRLADPLTVRSITSDRFGRLFHLRVSNQNTVLVNLPLVLPRDEQLTLHIEYGGRVEPQEPERELLAMQRDQLPLDLPDDAFPKLEPAFLYSNRSFWYPQPTITDYTTATLRIRVPMPYGVVASGTPATDSPRPVEAAGTAPAGRLFEFNAERPLRYLSFLVTKLQRGERRTVRFPREETVGPAADLEPLTLETAAYDTLDLIVDAQPRQLSRAKALAERTVDIAQFYESLLGDSPYASFNLTLLESLLPGGHSPGYFAVLNQPLNTGITWRNDPAAFANYPEFFLAHETAHQWWGQAVGWRNYHEQWLSEGFSQYFAALYAQKFRGDEVFAGVLKQMNRWAADESDQGPVYLGYRVGHIKSDGRAFRAVIYNKGAVLLHMLRLMVGDATFFKGVRRFYGESRFRKVGSDDFRRAMETESGLPLDRFFERWVYNSTRPSLSFSHRVETGAAGQEAVLHFEQGDEVFDFPVVVTLQFTDRREVNVVVSLTDKIVDVRVPIEGTLRGVEINRDTGGLAEMARN